MLKTIAIIFGIIMVAVGILGFVPQANTGDLLLGIFRVNGVHNLIHLATGAVAILCGLSTAHASKVFFQVFGIVYAIVAVLGFFYMDHSILGLVANNMADNLLHIVIAAASLYLGFAFVDRDIPSIGNP